MPAFSSVHKMMEDFFEQGTSSTELRVKLGKVLSVPASVLNVTTDAFVDAGLAVNHQSARVDAALSLVDDTSVQPIFPAANDSLTVVAGQSYRFESLIKLTKGTNAVSLNFALVPTTATFTTCNYVSFSTAAASGTAAAAIMNNHEVATTTVVAASSASVNMRIFLTGEFEINAGGTIAPSVIWSGATGSTPTVNVGSFFECWPTGANPVTIHGPWA
jgi:hypothetical protein